MCSLCCLCSVGPVLCPAWPYPVRLTPSDPKNYQIAELQNCQGAHFDGIANSKALQRDSALFNQPCLLEAPKAYQKQIIKQSPSMVCAVTGTASKNLLEAL